MNNITNLSYSASAHGDIIRKAIFARAIAQAEDPYKELVDLRNYDASISAIGNSIGAAFLVAEVVLNFRMLQEMGREFPSAKTPHDLTEQQRKKLYDKYDPLKILAL